MHGVLVVFDRYKFSPWSFSGDEKLLCVIKMFKDLFDASRFESLLVLSISVPHQCLSASRHPVNPIVHSYS